jgi:hypothetical protein
MWRKRETQAATGTTRAQTPADSPADGTIREWRRQRLARIGFDPELASAIAADCAYDLHALIGLVERGCPPPLAVRILAPLGNEADPC